MLFVRYAFTALVEFVSYGNTESLKGQVPSPARFALLPGRLKAFNQIAARLPNQLSQASEKREQRLFLFTF